MHKATVIIPVFNQAALTAQCLRSVAGRERCEWVVVDDASSDNTPEILAGFGDKLKVVRHANNMGFAVSCNDGAEQSSGDWLVFLNNDTLPQPGWLEALLHYAHQHPKAAVAGSKLIYPNGSIQHAGVVVCRDRYPRHIYSGFPGDHPAVNKSRRFQIVTGACMLVRREVFREAGGFDVGYRNGFEDVDFCLRLGESGYEIHYCADSVVQHLESVSPGRFKADRENLARYRERWIDRVRSDDLDYYVEDDLLRLSYEGQYPLVMEISPLLATVHAAARTQDLERRVREQSREIAELRRENTRLLLELGSRAPESPELQYQELRSQVRETVQQLVPLGATLLVISKGDGALLDLPGYQAWHFPQTERGAYAGHHPASSAEAIAALEALRSKGAAYFLIPATCLWWLEFYTEFRDHLDTFHTRLAAPGHVGILYRLNEPGGRTNSRQPQAAPSRSDPAPQAIKSMGKQEGRET